MARNQQLLSALLRNYEAPSSFKGSLLEEVPIDIKNLLDSAMMKKQEKLLKVPILSVGETGQDLDA